MGGRPEGAIDGRTETGAGLPPGRRGARALRGAYRPSTKPCPLGPTRRRLKCWHLPYSPPSPFSPLPASPPLQVLEESAEAKAAGLPPPEHAADNCMGDTMIDFLFASQVGEGMGKWPVRHLGMIDLGVVCASQGG